MGEWQPIETAPKDGVLLMYEPHQQRAGISERTGFWFPGCWWGGGWRNTIDQREQQPSHWMPLPSPPAHTPSDEDQGQ